MKNTNTEIGSFFEADGREYVRISDSVIRLVFTFEGETKSKDFYSKRIEEAKSLARQLRAGVLPGYAFVSLKHVTVTFARETETSMEMRGS